MLSHLACSEITPAEAFLSPSVSCTHLPGTFLSHIAKERQTWSNLKRKWQLNEISLKERCNKLRQNSKEGIEKIILKHLHWAQAQYRGKVLPQAQCHTWTTEVKHIFNHLKVSRLSQPQETKMQGNGTGRTQLTPTSFNGLLLYTGNIPAPVLVCCVQCALSHKPHTCVSGSLKSLIFPINAFQQASVCFGKKW